MILGVHSLEEARQLVDVIDYRYKRVDNAIHGIVLDSASQRLYQDWGNAYAKWALDAAGIRSDMDHLSLINPLVPESVLGAESLWQRALKYVESGNAWAPDDIRSLQPRIEAIIGHLIDIDTGRPAINMTDPDMKLLQAADFVIKKVIEPAGAAAKSAATSKYGLAIGAGVVGVLGVVVLTKVYL